MKQVMKRVLVMGLFAVALAAPASLVYAKTKGTCTLCAVELWGICLLPIASGPC